MLKRFKRIAAAVLASVVTFTCTGCTAGKSTAYALTVDGYQIKAGVYIWYSLSALTEATNLAMKQDENLKKDDEKALKKVKLEGKDFLEYVKDKTTENCINHVAIIKHFDELGLSLTEEEEEEIEEAVDANWEQAEEQQNKLFTKNGIGKESLEEIYTNNYKSDAIFNAYYGEEGSEKVTEEQLKDYYTENNARVRYIDMDLHDAEGNDLDDAGKKEIKDMADSFLKRAKAAGNEEEMMAEFDKFQEEYDKYVSDKAAEAAGSDEEGSTEAVTDAATEPETEPETEAETTAATESDSSNADSGRSSESEAGTQGSTEPTEESTNEESVTTTAPEEDEEAPTTTTTAPYAAETIVHVITTEEGTKEEDVKYTPSKKCYDWIFNTAKTGVPEIVEDDHTIYVIVRLDINERMNDDDLWTEGSTTSVRSEMFSDDMEDMIKSWGGEYEVVKNKRAYKKYDPFKIDTETE